jgi:hypothetical protein
MSDFNALGMYKYVPLFKVLGTVKSSVADPKQKFRIRFRIRIRPEVSFSFGSRLETGQNFFFCSKIFTQPHLGAQ